MSTDYRRLNSYEAAEYLGCSRSQLMKLVHQRRIPAYHIGAKVLFNAAALDEWMAKGGTRADDATGTEG